MAKNMKAMNNFKVNGVHIRRVLGVMKLLLMLPLYIVGYIFYSIYCIFCFCSKLVSNLFEQKCCKSIDEIVAKS